MEVRLEHPQKDSYPIEVTEFGIFTDLRLIQPLKAPLLIDITDSGIMIFLT